MASSVPLTPTARLGEDRGAIHRVAMSFTARARDLGNAAGADVFQVGGDVLALLLRIQRPLPALPM